MRCSAVSCRLARRTRSALSCPAAPKGGCLRTGRFSNAALEMMVKNRRLPSGARIRKRFLLSISAACSRWIRSVRTAMRDADISDPADVHFVQIQCPLLTAGRMGETLHRGGTLATTDTLKSMGLSRAASALGVAVALGEMKRSGLTDSQIGSRWDLWSARASCSAGIELAGHEIIVLGMSNAWSGPLAIDHAVMTDAIDV